MGLFKEMLNKLESEIQHANQFNRTIAGATNVPTSTIDWLVDSVDDFEKEAIQTGFARGLDASSEGKSV